MGLLLLVANFRLRKIDKSTVIVVYVSPEGFVVFSGGVNFLCTQLSFYGTKLFRPVCSSTVFVAKKCTFSIALRNERKFHIEKCLFTWGTWQTG